MGNPPKIKRFEFDAPVCGTCDVLFVAGEHSGDEQAARMLRAALDKNPKLRACAFGGAELKAAGAQMLFDMTSFSVLGLAEVLKNYAFFKRLSEGVIEWIKKFLPKSVCFVDYPGFNLHIASSLKKVGVSRKGGGNVKLLYYISPQIWAWKAGRRFKMASILDELAVIFPFESACYADTTLPVHFVGHPFLDKSYQNPLYFDKSGKVLLLAGSRASAVTKIFPSMVRTLKLLPDVLAVAPYPTNAILKIMKGIISKFPDVEKRVEFVENRSGNIGAKAVMMSSGTMSLSCSLAGIPGLIVYVANPFTYAVGKMVVKVKYLSIADIVLDRPAWPEFIQFAASPKRMAARLAECMENPEVVKDANDAAAELKKLLSAPRKMSAANWLLTASEVGA